VSVKNLKQTVTIRATPHDVYRAIVDPEEHEAFTGAAAELEPKVGGMFSHYDGSLTGVVLDIKPDARIVLGWRSGDWPEGAYSVAQFLFKKVKGGTRIEFSQFGIPTGDFKDISSGWRTYYWSPLKEYLET
jgi:activator of HSP90 ATPase